MTELLHLASVPFIYRIDLAPGAFFDCVHTPCAASSGGVSSHSADLAIFGTIPPDTQLTAIEILQFNAWAGIYYTACRVIDEPGQGPVGFCAGAVDPPVTKSVHLNGNPVGSGGDFLTGDGSAYGGDATLFAYDPTAGIVLDFSATSDFGAGGGIFVEGYIECYRIVPDGTHGGGGSPPRPFMCVL